MSPLEGRSRVKNLHTDSYFRSDRMSNEFQALITKIVSHQFLPPLCMPQHLDHSKIRPASVHFIHCHKFEPPMSSLLAISKKHPWHAELKELIFQANFGSNTEMVYMENYMKTLVKSSVIKEGGLLKVIDRPQYVKGTWSGVNQHRVLIARGWPCFTAVWREVVET